MADGRVGLGPSGETVAANVRRLREQAGLSFAELARRLDETGRAIPALGLRRIEAHERRVDSDDLVALAIVFGVSPATLLMPDTGAEEDLVEVTGAPSVEAGLLWTWLTCEAPLTTPAPGDDRLRFNLENKPGWAQSMLARQGVIGRNADEVLRQIKQLVGHLDAGGRPDGNH